MSVALGALPKKRTLMDLQLTRQAQGILKTPLTNTGTGSVPPHPAFFYWVQGTKPMLVVTLLTATSQTKVWNFFSLLIVWEYIPGSLHL